MKNAVLIVIAAVIVAMNSAAREPEIAVPELHKIKRVTLSPSYSCRSRQEFHTGYANTALFLTPGAKEINSPDLLFNGACNSPDYFQAAGAGDDLDVITDYGDIPMAELTGNHLFSPQRRADSLATFAQSAKAHAGHTYGVLINKPDRRGFFYFRVLAHVPNRKVELEYVVMDYQVLNIAARSPGFAWDIAGSYPCGEGKDSGC